MSISENTGNITKDEFYESMVGTAPDKERVFFDYKSFKFLEKLYSKNDIVCWSKSQDTQEKVDEIFNIVDRNDDGKIDFIEFFCRLPQILNMK